MAAPLVAAIWAGPHPANKRPARVVKAPGRAWPQPQTGLAIMVDQEGSRPLAGLRLPRTPDVKRRRTWRRAVLIALAFAAASVLTGADAEDLYLTPPAPRAPPVRPVQHRPSPHRHVVCVDFAGEALNRSDKLAFRLHALSSFPSDTLDEEAREDLKQAARYIFLAGRLLSVSAFYGDGCRPPRHPSHAYNHRPISARAAGPGGSLDHPSRTDVRGVRLQRPLNTAPSNADAMRGRS
jgi:hypothetical protein